MNKEFISSEIRHLDGLPTIYSLGYISALYRGLVSTAQDVEPVMPAYRSIVSKALREACSAEEGLCYGLLSHIMLAPMSTYREEKEKIKCVAEAHATSDAIRLHASCLLMNLEEDME
jgi:hypothetical protein